MKRILSILVFALSLPTMSSNTIIEIADFNCKYCKEAESYNDLIKIKLKKNDKLVFAPISSDVKQLSWPLTYYQLRDTLNEEKLRETIFTIVQDYRITANNSSEATDNITTLMTISSEQSLRVQEAIRNPQKSGQAVIALKKAMNLVEEHNITNTPTYLIVKSDGEILKINKPISYTTKEYINLVIENYQGIIDNEE